MLAPSVIAPVATGEQRHESWLRDELETIWARYFADVPRANTVEISYASAWKRRLGVIRMAADGARTEIGINALLRHADAPYCLTLITLAHELVHYSHGFGSPLPRAYRFPHQGGIVDRALIARGLAAELLEYGDWIGRHWWSFYARQAGRRRANGRG